MRSRVYSLHGTVELDLIAVTEDNMAVPCWLTGVDPGWNPLDSPEVNQLSPSPPY